MSALPITVHIGEARTRHTRPLCMKDHRPDRVSGHLTTWTLSAVGPPTRVHLGGTGYDVPVTLMGKVQCQGGRPVVPCEECLKALSSLPDRLSPAS